MTALALREHAVTVAGKPVFVAEAGDGPPVVMLHGGGPGTFPTAAITKRRSRSAAA